MDKNPEISDSKLIEGCKKNDAVLQRVLFDRFSRKMMALCRRYARNKMEAEDCFQEGFVKVFSKIGQLSEGPLEGWMIRIFVNTCISQYRTNKKTYFFLDVETHDFSGQDEDALHQMQTSELMNLIEVLPEGAKVIFNLFAIEGYPHTEIAEMLGISEGASRSQLARARKLLQQQLKQLS